MIDPASLDALTGAVRDCINAENPVLEQMRAKVRELKRNTRRIHPRSATAISLVGTDGGNNQIHFDPFMIQLIRVVDSSQNEYCLEAITPRSAIEELNTRHINPDGKGRTALGRLMVYLGIEGLHKLSPVFKLDPDKRSASWVQVYREMTEWAVLFSLVHEKDFANDTVIVCDGFLRSKMFSTTAKGEALFKKYRIGLEEGIQRQFGKNRRRLYVVGIAKHSKVLQVYRLAMAIEGVMRNAYACYVEVPRELEEKVYKWSEYATGGGEGESFVAGKMFLVKFGAGLYDPVWAIDLLASQVDEAATVFGYLLEDAKDGFPVPFYPQCLQRAHEHAALVDFDMDILQDVISEVLRSSLGDEKKWTIDELAFQESDPSRQRYA
jgi:hypothetical protein